MRLQFSTHWRFNWQDIRPKWRSNLKRCACQNIDFGAHSFCITAWINLENPTFYISTIRFFIKLSRGHLNINLGFCKREWFVREYLLVDTLPLTVQNWRWPYRFLWNTSISNCYQKHRCVIPVLLCRWRQCYASNMMKQTFKCGQVQANVSIPFDSKAVN